MITIIIIIITILLLLLLLLQPLLLLLLFHDVLGGCRGGARQAGRHAWAARRREVRAGRQASGPDGADARRAAELDV